MSNENVTDSDVVDRIATMLGTCGEWNGGDMLDSIANQIGEVRPHPGDAVETYREDFKSATGRDVPADFDTTDDWVDPPTYSIVRFFRDDRPREVIDTGLTLEDAQAHCRSEDTHGDGWFDGYEKE